MTKRCIECKQEFPATLKYFYKRQGAKDGLRNNCKSCQRDKSSNWKKANPEKHKELLAAWRKANPGRQKELHAAWKKANPDRLREINRKKHAKKLGIKHVDWSEKELFERYGTNCYICNDAIDFTAPKKGPGYEKSSWPDHVIPVSRGGSNTIENVRPCHAKCNKSKKDKTYDEYMESIKCLT